MVKTFWPNAVFIFRKTIILQCTLLFAVATMSGCEEQEDEAHQSSIQSVIDGHDGGNDSENFYPAVVAVAPVPMVAVGDDPYDWARAQDAANAHLCSGTVVAKRVVLTAAHCVLESQVIESLIKDKVCSAKADQQNYCEKLGFSIYFGPNVTDISNHRPSGAGKMIMAKETIVHDGYDPKKPMAGNDIALVILSEDVDGEIEPMRINNREIGPDDLGKTVQNVGYGFGEYIPWNFLKEKSNWDKLGMRRMSEASLRILPANKKFIYASEKQDGAYTTGGDSGGPAIVDDKIVAVHSWGWWSIWVGWYGTSERIAPYMKWIRSELKARHILLP